MKKILTLSGIFLTFLLITNVRADEPNLVTAVSDVAQKTGPTVVAIKTERTEHYRPQTSYYGSPYNDDFLNQFFSDFFGPQPEYEQKLRGLGSGVIIDARGYILTNDHVVQGADKMTVTLPDGRKFDGSLIGTDTRSDLAVIKINPSAADKNNPTVPVAPLGNSENLKIGQWVVAIGNPFGNVLDDPQPTVTSGVISALHRTLPRTSQRDSDYSDLIQTDAAINPGNSGGPLVNLYGEVVGINVAIFSTSGGYQGIGFAIPINYAKAIVEELIAGKKVKYGWIGVSIQDLDERLANYFNLGEVQGVLVLKVLPNSPAQKAGLRDGDIIISVNGIPVKNTSALTKQVNNAPIGKSATIKLLRDNKDLSVSVTIGERPSSEQDLIQKSASVQTKPLKANEPWRGMKIKNLTEEISQKLGLSTTTGVIITAIKPDSPAAKAGLRKGDVIVSINKQLVSNAENFYAISAKTDGNCLIGTVRGFFVLETE